ncbi:hypothetical protein APHAL10511_004229 [Amanita phalloides]|nr:hypothetical protein APHAL10511_004229 [Amanita phalloides]
MPRDVDDADVHEAEHISLLVDQLNDVLQLLNINLSIPIESPLDLTPSLLIAILESLLGTRIPIDEFAIPMTPERKNETVENMNKVQHMKIFLGVLEHDILGMDVGLSDVDPRRLARGSWEEVMYVAKILCWIGIQLREAYQTPMEETVVPSNDEYTDDKQGNGEPMGLGIYESSDDSDFAPKLEDTSRIASPSLLSELDLNTNFTLRVPSEWCNDCQDVDDMDLTICAPLSSVDVKHAVREYV